MSDKILPLNDEWRLKVSGMNVELEQLREVTSEKKGTRNEWCWVGYYGSIQQAVMAIPKQITLHSEYAAWDELCDRLAGAIEGIEKQ